MTHYFDPDPTVRSAPGTVTLALPDLTVTLATDRGVFSPGRIDPGTKLLLQEAPHPPATGELLDVGCGYGPIAVALATRAPAARVWAVDVNSRARELAAANAPGNMTVAAPQDVPASTRFAATYSNPPVRIGKHALHELLALWVPRSNVTYLVVHRHLGADSLAAWMSGAGWEVSRLVSRLGYRVLQVTAS